MPTKLTNYTSEIDQYLQAFDKKNPNPSLSQQEEQKKHNLIRLLRDTAPNEKQEAATRIWKDF